MKTNVSPDELKKILVQTTAEHGAPTLRPPQEPKKVPPLARTLIGAGAGIVVYLIIAANQKGSPPLLSTRPPERLDPQQIVQTYLANVVRGDQTFKGRRLAVDAKVFQVVNSPAPGFVGMVETSIIGCRTMRSGQEEALGRLSTMDIVGVQGTIEGVDDSAVTLSDCVLSH